MRTPVPYGRDSPNWEGKQHAMWMDTLLTYFIVIVPFLLLITLISFRCPAQGDNSLLSKPFMKFYCPSPDTQCPSLACSSRYLQDTDLASESTGNQPSAGIVFAL